VYTQGGTSGYGSENLPSWAYREPSSSEGSSTYPAYSQYQSQYQSPYQSSQYYGPSSSGYTDAPYGSQYPVSSQFQSGGYAAGQAGYGQTGSLPSWAYTEPSNIESSQRYPVSGQYQSSGYSGGQIGSQGYGGLPSWTRQEVGDREHYASRYQPRPGYSPTTGYQSGGYSAGQMPGQAYGGLPSWTRQEVGDREHYASRYQPSPGYSPTTGYQSGGYSAGQMAGQGYGGQTNLPSWTRQEVGDREHYSSTYQPNPPYSQGSFSGYQSRPVIDPTTGRQYGPY